MAILDRLNVRIEDFFLLSKGESTEKQALYLQSYNEYYSTGSYSMEFENMILEKYKETKDFYYLALSTQMLGIEWRNNKEITAEKKKRLDKNTLVMQEHLNRVTNWNHLELAFFTNCLFLFDMEYIQIVYKRKLWG